MSVAQDTLSSELEAAPAAELVGRLAGGGQGEGAVLKCARQLIAGQQFDAALRLVHSFWLGTEGGKGGLEKFWAEAVVSFWESIAASPEEWHSLPEKEFCVDWFCGRIECGIPLAKTDMVKLERALGRLPLNDFAEIFTGAGITMAAPSNDENARPEGSENVPPLEEQPSSASEQDEEARAQPMEMERVEAARARRRSLRKSLSDRRQSVLLTPVKEENSGSDGPSSMEVSADVDDVDPRTGGEEATPGDRAVSSALETATQAAVQPEKFAAIERGNTDDFSFLFQAAKKEVAPAEGKQRRRTGEDVLCGSLQGGAHQPEKRNENHKRQQDQCCELEKRPEAEPGPEFRVSTGGRLHQFRAWAWLPEGQHLSEDAEPAVTNLPPDDSRH